ncbi:hypothetical protein SAMN04487948_105290 [Halogranum amylolyticum]|uniref:Luciferase domain-containing protein n=1 Tax=Halogranum amylolyticum TaxID=660520 RepID=A0A1H8SS56_9EURY|nr:luciferase family protein [Halogranum amylolyticum]SEO81427.1 hypothetical protein SAMN04487948_105290 [Halogranum amylolyticum]
MFSAKVAEFPEYIVRRVDDWPDVQTINSEDSVELRVAGSTLGVVHEVGVVDLAFSPAIRDQLLTEGRADRHRTDPRSSWVSVRVRTGEDVADALWLLRFAYLCRLSECSDSDEHAATSAVDVDDEFARLGLSTSLWALTRERTPAAEHPTRSVDVVESETV